MDRRKETTAKRILLIFCIFIFLILAAALILFTAQSSGQGQHLLITAAVSADYDTVSLTESGSVQCRGLKDLSIRLNGKTQPLEEVLGSNQIVPAQLDAFARADAQNGYCTMAYTSKHGLATFVYQYDGFDLTVVHDIYETPDGKQHLIEQLKFYAKGIYDPTNPVAYLAENAEDPNQFLDREDWGLHFEVTSASPSGVRISVSQSGGQQIGQLSITEYDLYAEETETWHSASIGSIEIPMASGGSLEIVWPEDFGTLLPGNYVLKLMIEDTYDPAQVHPLMDNYYDRQSYLIHFSIS